MINPMKGLSPSLNHSRPEVFNQAHQGNKITEEWGPDNLIRLKRNRL
jgi:hypothetical protein